MLVVSFNLRLFAHVQLIWRARLPRDKIKAILGGARVSENNDTSMLG